MLYGVVGLVVLILDIFAILEVLKSGLDTAMKAVWILVILLLPVVGMILWFVFGRKGGL